MKVTLGYFFGGGWVGGREGGGDLVHRPELESPLDNVKNQLRSVKHFYKFKIILRPIAENVSAVSTFEFHYDLYPFIWKGSQPHTT